MADMEIEKKKTYEKRIIFLFFLAWGFTFFNRLSINFAMPAIQEDLNLTATHTGIVVFAATLAMAVSAVIIGNISDKQGRRKRFLVPAVLLVGIGSAASVLATSFTLFVIIRIFVGLGLGPVLGMIFAITEAASSENKFGRNTGLIMAGDALFASIIGPIAVTQLIGVFSWQIALSITSIPTLVVALLIARIVPEISVLTSAKVVLEVDETSVLKRNPVEVFKYPNIVPCIILIVTTLGAYFSLIIYAPLYLTEIAGFSLETMGFTASLMGVIYIFYAVFIPRSTDRFGRKPVLIVTCLVCSLAPLSMFLFPTSNISIVGYVIFGGTAGAIHVFFNTIIPLESLPKELKTTGSSIIFTFGEVLGAATFPLISGIMADHMGYTAVMLLSAALFILSFGLCFLLKESNKSLIRQV